jgi:hypothetical protein
MKNALSKERLGSANSPVHFNRRNAKFAIAWYLAMTIGEVMFYK